MTDEEITKLARSDGWDMSHQPFAEILIRFARKAYKRGIEVEREACAKVCGDIAADMYSAIGCRAAVKCAEAIRARSNK